MEKDGHLSLQGSRRAMSASPSDLAWISSKADLYLGDFRDAVAHVSKFHPPPPPQSWTGHAEKDVMLLLEPGNT